MGVRVRRRETARRLREKEREALQASDGSTATDPHTPSTDTPSFFPPSLSVERILHFWHRSDLTPTGGTLIEDSGVSGEAGYQEDALLPHQNLSECPLLFCSNRSTPVLDEELASLAAVVKSFAEQRWPGLWEYHNQIEPFVELPVPLPPPESPRPFSSDPSDSPDPLFSLQGEAEDSRAYFLRFVQEWSRLLVGPMKPKKDGAGFESGVIKHRMKEAWFDEECKSIQKEVREANHVWKLVRDVGGRGLEFDRLQRLLRVCRSLFKRKQAA
uniref:Uncharacterized protein n=1 Tax=Chromera velia CCMP2878 TaxID=1169474 RepID=A0A0G4FUS0_9ALVE|eukprot:Cvel_18864.t1-p1 / transcript=Cvel_18864.t1 / gene=Cvel_18864 / organism=Chromera_velia_CCMP2878 / gene_product=hypothetical protein / transcript_product=hypothetical protein / location=Cvel_scaffold1587:25237-33512(-) / protein_length=270 / sequence_SO=supercontig / SO=protein_coding / is_pseudo=false